MTARKVPLTPAERAAQLEAAKAAKAKRAAQLKRGVEKILKDADTREVWKHIHWLCGWDASSVVLKTDGEVALTASVCNEQKRDVYRRLRKLAPRTVLSLVEEEAESAPEAAQPEEDAKES